MKYVVIYTCMILLFLASVPAMATEYQVSQLDPLSGFSESYGASINGRGQVAGVSKTHINGELVSRACVWDGSTVRQLDIPAGAVSSYACKINDDGVVIGYYETSPLYGPDKPHACYWDADGRHDFGYIQSWRTESVAYDMNASGIAVGYCEGDYAGDKACRFAQGYCYPVDEPAYISSRAYAINDLGVVVGAGYGTGGYQPCVWDDSGYHLLPNGGKSGGCAYDINNCGIIVGSVGEDACVWSATGIHFLSLPEGGSDASAVAINELGQIVGSMMRPSATNPLYSYRRAWLWDTHGGCDLGALLPSLSMVGDINNEGLVVGSAVLDTGYRAVVWTPVPEPSSIAALASSLAGCLACIRRRKRSG